ncbi:MAG: hypothetical protein IJ332_04090, partial [Clostridia bacterium]|nr:hypothetical protein [Clostridia bacterium]
MNKVKGNQYDYEMADCKNMSSRNYPYACPRKPRKKLIDEQGIKRIYKVEENRIYYIDAEDYLCYCEDGNKNYVLNGDGNKIQMSGVTCTNNYDKNSIFYPAIRYIDEENNIKTSAYKIQFGEPGELTQIYTGAGRSYSMKMTGVAYISNPVANEFNVKAMFPSENELNFPTNSAYLHVFDVVVTQYSEEGKNIEQKTLRFNADDYEDADSVREKIWNLSFAELKENDYFEFKVYYSKVGSESDMPTSYWSNMFDFIKQGNWTIEGTTEKGNPCDVAVKYGVVYNNRIVGVYKNNIRASVLGDFSNFWEYADEAGNPSATGAYATDVGSAGDFTGICAYNNVLLIFKKDIVYEMYGSMPYTITELCNTGCIDNDSIASIDGVLYWASPKGIVRYSGGVPNVISQKVDIDTSGICKAGTDGRRYYVYDGNKTFVYDTYYQMWHIEDETNVKMRYSHINDLFMVCDDGIYKADSGNESVEWEYTTKDFTFASKERKNLSKLWIRTDMASNTKLEIYVRQNGGEWLRA